MRESRLIKQIKDKAYSGIEGAKRNNFCREYRATLTRVRAKTESQFTAKLSFLGENVSCTRGCSACCFQHISAPAAHCIAVVDFLYEKDRVLTQFLNNYQSWQEKAGKLSQEIDTAYNKAIDPQRASISGATGKALSRRYFEQRIPCPFLVDSACSIYEIRPICCSAHRAVTPKEWCDPADTHEVHTYNAIPVGTDLRELVGLAPLRLTLYQVTLPAMVYRILTEDLADILTAIDREFPDVPGLPGPLGV
jgi:Fe-S-cluster containining protein